MRKKYQQMSLLDTCKNVEEQAAEQQTEAVPFVRRALGLGRIIPPRFYTAFYQRLGRKRGYELESFLRAWFLQRIFHYVEDSQLLNTLRFSQERGVPYGRHYSRQESNRQVF